MKALYFSRSPFLSRATNARAGPLAALANCPDLALRSQHTGFYATVQRFARYSAAPSALERAIALAAARAGARSDNKSRSAVTFDWR